MDYASYEEGRQQGRSEGQAYSGNSSSSGNGDGLAILLAIVALLIAIWACLYPLSAVASLATWVTLHLMIEPFAREQTGFNQLLVGYAIPSAVALVVLWGTSRLDHRLAKNLVYRLMRHLVRLALFMVVVASVHHKVQDGSWFIPRDLEHAWCVLTVDPVRVGLAITAVIAGHLTLWHWRRLRTGWHEAMEAMGLRPRGIVVAKGQGVPA